MIMKNQNYFVCWKLSEVASMVHIYCFNDVEEEGDE